MNTTLSDAQFNKKYSIIKILDDEPLKQKLLDFGFIRGVIIIPLFNSISNKSRGYKINGFVVGLRNNDAKKVLVEEYCGGSINE